LCQAHLQVQYRDRSVKNRKTEIQSLLYRGHGNEAESRLCLTRIRITQHGGLADGCPGRSANRIKGESALI